MQRVFFGGGVLQRKHRCDKDGRLVQRERFGQGEGVQSQADTRGELHGSHVVEGVIQLLADGFVLQFLGIQLI